MVVAFAPWLTLMGVLDALRFDLAKRHLADHNLSISKIAWLLGYSDVSAFTNAYKRRTGQTPRETRQRLHRGREESQAQKAD